MIKVKTGCAVLFSAAILAAEAASYATACAGTIDKTCSKTMDAGIVLSDDHGKIIYSQNRQKQFVPASILKILTSLAAIKTFGQNFRFSTRYFFDPDTKNLYLKGFGDPLFVSEVIEKLCSKIVSKTDTEQIHHIFVDQTFFLKQIQIPGQGNSLNPYDAPVGALCANFNTIMFKQDKFTGRFISAEPQTPLLSIFDKAIKKTGLRQGRIILSKQQSLLYPGFLIKYFFEQNSIRVTGSVLQKKFNARVNEGNLFFSPFTIKQVVQKLLKFSSNFMANQMLLAMGAKTDQAPATVEKGVKALKRFSKQHLNLDHLTVFEGSGISRLNHISPDQMIRILIEFLPFHSLLNRQGSDFFKTGTLADVRTRAGYIMGKDKRLYPYVIMVNQQNKGYDAILKNLIYAVSQK